MKRHPDESFENYKKRRKDMNDFSKKYKKGFLIWESDRNGPADSNILFQRSKELDNRLEDFCEDFKI